MYKRQLDYQAVKRNVEKDDLWDIIAEELLKYDEAQIIYSERGAKLVIDANAKKVNMRHEDVTKEINKTSVVQTLSLIHILQIKCLTI